MISELVSKVDIDFNKDGGKEGECKCMLGKEAQIIVCLECRWRKDGYEGIDMWRNYEGSSKELIEVNGDFIMEVVTIYRNYANLEENKYDDLDSQLSHSNIKVLSDNQNCKDFEDILVNHISMVKRNSTQNILRINKAYHFTQDDNLNSLSVNLNKEISLLQMKPKNHKFHTKNSIGQQFLETRYDVMNKNFIRFIKREIRKYFEEYLQKEKLKNTANSHSNNYQLFALYLLESTSVEWGNIIDFNIKTFRVYLMV